MADQSDVEEALLAIVSGALYPQGTTSGSATGADYRIYRGWPKSAALDADLRAGIVNVTLLPGAGPGKATSRFAEPWQTVAATPSLSASVSDDTVTFAGSAAAGQIAGLRINDSTFAYRTQALDTPQSVAANLATQARATAIVQLSSASLTVPGAWRLDARVVADQNAFREVRRQLQTMRITCWCPNPALRDVTAAAIDQALAAMTFIGLPDGSQAHLKYVGTVALDQSQDALLYRRDLLYATEYPTIVQQIQPSMLWGDLGIGAASFPA